jgi:hypothetical protein
VTLGTVSAVRRGFRLFGFRLNPKIKLGSKLIDHRLNKLKGVSSEVLVYSLGNFLRRMLLLMMNETVGRHKVFYR